MANIKVAPLTESQKEQARSLRYDGFGRQRRKRSWRKVAELMDVREVAVLREFAPGAARREKYPSKRDDGFLSATDFQGRLGHPLQIPEEVLAERERRYFLEHTSITAALMGDPLPTRSALDRRGS